MLGFVLFPWSFMPNLPQLLSTVISCLIVSLGETARASGLLNLGDMTRPVHVLITPNQCAQENIWDSSNPPNVLPGQVFLGPHPPFDLSHSNLQEPLTTTILGKLFMSKPDLRHFCIDSLFLVSRYSQLCKPKPSKGLAYTTRLFPNDNNNKIMVKI
jgi:hypothetical protein